MARGNSHCLCGWLVLFFSASPLLYPSSTRGGSAFMFASLLPKNQGAHNNRIMAQQPPDSRTGVAVGCVGGDERSSTFEATINSRLPTFVSVAQQDSQQDSHQEDQKHHNQHQQVCTVDHCVCTSTGASASATSVMPFVVLSAMHHAGRVRIILCCAERTRHERTLLLTVRRRGR